MSYKSENWNEKLEQVRNLIALKEGSVEKTADEILESQIEEELANSFIEEEVIDEKIVGTGEAISKIFKTKDKKEIDGIANLMNMTSVKVLQSMMKQNPKGFKRMAAKMGELPAMEEVEVEESVEKTTEKLVERNMLGRLAKQLKLNEEGKQKMFAYFEKGELQQ